MPCDFIKTFRQGGWTPVPKPPSQATSRKKRRNPCRPSLFLPGWKLWLLECKNISKYSWNIPKYFVQDLFRKNEDQLEDVCQSTQSSVELLQETVQCLQRSHHQVSLNFNSNSNYKKIDKVIFWKQASLLGERLEILDKSLNSSGLPPSPVIEETKD